MEIYGKVLDVEDPIKQCRIKVSILGYNDKLPIEAVKWIEPMANNVFGSFVLPLVDDFVKIMLDKDNDYIRWSNLGNNDSNLINSIGDDYSTAFVFGYRNLKALGKEGDMGLYWTNTDGLKLVNNIASLEIREDGTIILKNDEYSLHITKDNISLGSENKSKEPAVLGDQNTLALEKINDSINELHGIISKSISELNTVALVSPYTASLSPPLLKLSTELKTKSTILTKQNKTQIDKTNSKNVTLD